MAAHRTSSHESMLASAGDVRRPGQVIITVYKGMQGSGGTLVTTRHAQIPEQEEQIPKPDSLTSCMVASFMRCGPKGSKPATSRGLLWARDPLEGRLSTTSGRHSSWNSANSCCTRRRDMILVPWGMKGRTLATARS